MTTKYYLSLAQVFGEGAFQDMNTLVIQKASLPRLSASANNTAEGLLVAILIAVLLNFQGIIIDENNQIITDENNQPISFDNSESLELLKMIHWRPFQFNRNNQKYINHQIIVSIYAQN